MTLVLLSMLLDNDVQHEKEGVLTITGGNHRPEVVVKQKFLLNSYNWEGGSKTFPIPPGGLWATAVYSQSRIRLTYYVAQSRSTQHRHSSFLSDRINVENYLYYPTEEMGWCFDPDANDARRNSIFSLMYCMFLENPTRYAWVGKVLALIALDVEKLERSLMITRENPSCVQHYYFLFKRQVNPHQCFKAHCGFYGLVRILHLEIWESVIRFRWFRISSQRCISRLGCTRLRFDNKTGRIDMFSPHFRYGTCFGTIQWRKCTRPVDGFERFLLDHQQIDFAQPSSLSQLCKSVIAASIASSLDDETNRTVYTDGLNCNARPKKMLHVKLPVHILQDIEMLLDVWCRGRFVLLPFFF